MGEPNMRSARSTMSMALSTPAQNPRGFARMICMAGILPVPAARQPGIEQQQPGADANGRIGDIEGWKIVPVPVDIDEVDYMTQPQPVDHVADRAPEDQRHRAREHARTAIDEPQPADQRASDDQRQPREQPAL